MELTLTRNQFTKDGIFGTLVVKQAISDTVDKYTKFATLEHAYQHTNYSVIMLNNGISTPGVVDLPKLPDGTYLCEKGLHRLENMIESFPAFEIMNVPNHTDILIHYGNFNRDSEGCVLLGKQKFGPMITQSQAAFHEFMKIMDDVDEFTLTVNSLHD